MDANNLKCVVAAKNGEPAIIRFFDSVNDCSVANFVEEFLWLQDYVKPEKIVVLINSEGGSVLKGMAAFSVIQNCPIEVDCVVEGIAASMATILWVAGDNLYMHDYSILMIHNPFCYDRGSEDESAKNMINAFKSQLSTIYQKRLGLDKETVEGIMNGEGKADGTYFNAEEAVAAGLISKDHIIKTSKQVKDKVKNQIEGITDNASIRDIMSSISAEMGTDKLVEAMSAIHNQTEQSIQTQKTKAMEKEILSFNAVAAQLGFSADVEVAPVSARITELLKAESDLKAAQDEVAKLGEAQAKLDKALAEIDELKIQFAGKEAEATNALSELESVKASLKVYQDAEKAQREAEIEATVQAAIEAGKIEEASKENWIAMAQSNFEMVKATLDSIRGREVVTKEIANDPANAKAAEEALKTAEAKMAEKVAEVVGNVELKTF